MPNHGFAFFVKHPRRMEELRYPHPVEKEQEYEVVKTIRLARIDYENFITDMAADRQFLEDNAALCGRCGEIIRCLRVTCPRTDESILVVPDAAWAGLAALEPET